MQIKISSKQLSKVGSFHLNFLKSFYSQKKHHLIDSSKIMILHTMKFFSTNRKNHFFLTSKRISLTSLESRANQLTATINSSIHMTLGMMSISTTSILGRKRKKGKKLSWRNLKTEIESLFLLFTKSQESRKFRKIIIGWRKRKLRKNSSKQRICLFLVSTSYRHP